MLLGAKKDSKRYNRRRRRRTRSPNEDLNFPWHHTPARRAIWFQGCHCSAARIHGPCSYREWHRHERWVLPYMWTLLVSLVSPRAERVENPSATLLDSDGVVAWGARWHQQHWAWVGVTRLCRSPFLSQVQSGIRILKQSLEGTREKARANIIYLISTY